MFKTVFPLLFFPFLLFSGTTNVGYNLSVDQNQKNATNVNAFLGYENDKWLISTFRLEHRGYDTFYEQDFLVGYTKEWENLFRGFDLKLDLSSGVRYVDVEIQNRRLYRPVVNIALELNRVFLPRIYTSFSSTLHEQHYLISTRVGLPLPTAVYDSSIVIGVRFIDLSEEFVQLSSLGAFLGLHVAF